MRTPRSLLVASLLAFGVLGCQPLAVHADSSGTQKLPLPGETRVEGVVTRALVHEGFVVPKGTRVRIEETWLLRHDRNAKPPGYRITGLYDPTTQSDGLALPKHSIDTYYIGALLPEAEKRVPVPAAHFKRDAR